MKILAFAGSNSATSINKQLVSHAAERLSATHQTEVLDLNDYEMPIYGIEHEKQHGVPQPALDFAKKIDESDVLLLSLAEHNGAYSVAFKNLFDWMSRIPNRRAVWGNKPMVLMATSPGAKGGSAVLEIAKTRFPMNGANVVATFSLPSFHSHFDPQQGITDEALRRSFDEALSSVK